MAILRTSSVTYSVYNKAMEWKLVQIITLFNLLNRYIIEVIIKLNKHSLAFCERLCVCNVLCFVM